VRAIWLGIVSAVLATSSPDSAAPPPRASALLSAQALSIGSPNGGRLDGGARLSETPYLRVVPYYAETNARWGLPALVGLIDRAARVVARKYPDAVLSVGDLSRKGGGELDRHHSHESGRDADVGFYLRNPKRPILATRFVAFAASGVAPTMPGAVFDDARNWAFVEAVLEDQVTRVSYIFVAAHIRARLLRYAEQLGAPRPIRERAAELMMQPRRAAHDDHFHIRIACPREQHGTCIEEAIVYTSRKRPAVAPTRQRSGTDDRDERTKSLPVLPPGPRAGGLVARLGKAVEDADFAPDLETTSSATEAAGRPLANAAGADNVEP